ncbi:MAG: 3-methyl-2-oxobutanoate hydroxymethyltransferase [Kiritimatiellae bacterium]|nr:3-methyl-2-oxobutanoate hydroxymethyltransferase [Kiritimatiellia bacterium]
MKWTIRKFRQCKGGEPLGLVTAYDYVTARFAARAGVPLVLVGDSLATTALGHSTTLPATMDAMIHHAEAVRRGAPDALVVGDMPFLSYATVEDAVRNAGRFLREAGCDAVKLEGGVSKAPAIAALVAEGIPVQAHIGLQPQSVKSTGYAVRGRTPDDAAALGRDLDAVCEAGAFSVVLEGVVPEVAAELTARAPIPTIGVGAGSGCDAQYLVLADLLGLGDGPLPKLAKSYAHLADDAVAAISAYMAEVSARKFPDAEHSY